MDEFLNGFLQVFTWPTLPLMVTGIAVGFIVGILPGLGGPAALAIMLPFSFDMKPVEAFAFLLGMFAVTSTTGDITAVLFGVPGEPTSAATVLDGHAMAKRGEAGRALGAALMSSLVGAVIGAFVLAAAIPIVRPVVLLFRSPEFLALGLLGIAFVASVNGSRRLQGLLAGGVGLLLSMVGLDPQSGVERYTFGQLGLWEGISVIAVTVGLFGIPEVVELWAHGGSIAQPRVGALGGVWQGVKDTFIHFGVTARCSMIGTLFGIIPGLGAALSQWIAYSHAVQSSKDKSQFGRGDVRGVLGPGAANNSSAGGGLVPTVAFGVPGNAVMAILLAALLIQGLTPGPDLLTKNVDLIFSMVWIIVVSNAITVAFCFLFLSQLVKITYVRGMVLIPVVILLLFVGSYTEGNSFLGVIITLAAGALGTLMQYLGWPRPPLILGLVLGRMLEKNMFTTYEAYGWSFLSRPFILAVLAILGGIVLLPLVRRARGRRNQGPTGVTQGQKEAPLAPAAD